MTFGFNIDLVGDEPDWPETGRIADFEVMPVNNSRTALLLRKHALAAACVVKKHRVRTYLLSRLVCREKRWVGWTLRTCKRLILEHLVSKQTGGFAANPSQRRKLNEWP